MYFLKEGKENTQQTVSQAILVAEQQNINYIVIASNTGETAKLLSGCNPSVICVTHAQGFKENGQNEMSDEAKNELQAMGMQVLTTSHILSGAERAISRLSGGMYPVEIIARSLKMFGQGIKVCVEVAVMALDAGLIPYGEKIIAIGGTGRGADTAAVLTPAHAQNVFDTRIHELICKPL